MSISIHLIGKIFPEGPVDSWWHCDLRFEPIPKKVHWENHLKWEHENISPRYLNIVAKCCKDIITNSDSLWPFPTWQFPTSWMSHWKTAVSGEQNMLTSSNPTYIYIWYITYWPAIYIYVCDTLLACMFSQTKTNTFNQMFFRGKICQLFRRVHFREILSPFQRHQGLAPRITFVVQHGSEVQNVQISNAIWEDHPRDSPTHQHVTLSRPWWIAGRGPDESVRILSDHQSLSPQCWASQVRYIFSAEVKVEISSGNLTYRWKVINFNQHESTL